MNPAAVSQGWTKQAGDDLTASNPCVLAASGLCVGYTGACLVSTPWVPGAVGAQPQICFSLYPTCDANTFSHHFWCEPIGKEKRRMKWQRNPIFLPGEFHGQRSLVGYSPWGHKESDTTEWLHFLSSCPGVELLDHVVAVFLVFWGTTILFSIVALPIYIPTNSVRGFPFFQYFLFLDILLIDFLTGAKWYLIMVLICIYLIINNSNVEHLFMCLLDICMSSLKKSLFSKGLLLPIFWLNFFYIELYKLLVYFGK